MWMDFTRYALYGKSSPDYYLQSSLKADRNDFYIVESACGLLFTHFILLKSAFL